MRGNDGQETWAGDLWRREGSAGTIEFMGRVTYGEPEEPPQAEQKQDRRRPGRSDVDPALKNLLRDPAGADPSPADIDEWAPMEPERPSAGVGLGLGVLILAWMVAGAIGYALM